MARFEGNGSGHIENPEAYSRAIGRNIKANRYKTGDRELLATAPDVHAWLNPNSGEKHPAGVPPKFLYDSVRQWGGLTAGQLAFARRILAERLTTNVTRDAERAAEKANAPAWIAGRHTVTATVLSTRTTESDQYGTQYKMLVKLEDGRKLWVTIPSGISVDSKGRTFTFAVTVTPSNDDHSFAFGSRPTVKKAELERLEATRV